MAYTTQDLVNAVREFQAMTLPPALRQGKVPSLFELTQAKNKMFEIADALEHQAARETMQ